jgi:hypothetical protein
MTKDYTPDELDAVQAKPRPRGSLPYLPKERDPLVVAAWLTLALRPPEGWRVTGFERAGRDPLDPCSLMLMNGRETRAYRFKHQRDLGKTSRTTILAASDGWLAVPHLTGSEIEDVWAALVTLGSVTTEHDERDEARKWVEQMLPATLPVTGHTLVPDGRHAALMVLKHQGEFTKPDALVLARPGEDQRYIQRPVRFIDSATGEQWVRAGELATYIRWVLGVEPLSHATLRARLSEVGVVGRLFEDYHPPHPKLNLYGLTEELVESLETRK